MEKSFYGNAFEALDRLPASPTNRPVTWTPIPLVRLEARIPREAGGGAALE